MGNILIFSLIIWSLFCYTFSKSNPECVNCKSYVPNKFNKNHGYCKIFADKVYFNNNQKLVYNFAEHCRDNEYLCGKNAFLFEHIDSEPKNNYIDIMSKKTIDEIELNTRLITILLQFKNSFLDNSTNEEKEIYLDNFTEEEKKYVNNIVKNIVKNI
jgi:hypothetical protein